MNKEELAPHVKEIARVLGNKVDESKIEHELSEALNVYRVSLDAGKRMVVRLLGGDANLLSHGARMRIADLQGGEQSVDLLVKVLTANPKSIEVDGRPRQLTYGYLADESGSAPYTLWEGGKAQLRPGEVVLIRNAYVKKYNERVDVNLGTRAEVESRPADELEGVVASAPSSSFSGGPMELADLQEGMNSVTVTVLVLNAEKKEVEISGAKKVITTGMVADASGKVPFTDWTGGELQANEAVRIENAYVKGFKGMPKLNIGDRARVVRLPPEQAPRAAGAAAARSIEDVERVGGASDVMFRASVVDVKEGSGLIFRCPQCKRVLLKSACRLHGKVEGLPDLRIKAVMDDGTGAITAVIGRTSTEAMIGLTLDECMRIAREAMDVEVVRQRIEEKVFGRALQVTGNVLKDDYGLMMIVSSAAPATVDVKEEATILLTNLEGFQ
jgi:replication factor A1